MKNYIQPGEKITVPAPYDVASGGGALVGAMFGVAAVAALSGAPVTLVRKGVYSMNKLSAQAWDVGAKVYWNDTAKECTTVASGNTHVGFAAAAASDPSTSGVVALI